MQQREQDAKIVTFWGIFITPRNLGSSIQAQTLAPFLIPYHIKNIFNIMKVCLKACLILLIVISSSVTQQNITRSCGSDAIYLQQLQTNPAFLQTRNLISDHTHTYQSGQGMRRAEIHIPVVVHVVYNTELQNISDSQIIAQINILNKDFGTIQTQKYAQAAASSIDFTWPQ
ncbi:MAG: hypothetical protein IPK94_05220 [Saprospiraceae bacterium]|nr:hypothetical protein [Saprospiraceae bacterium]